MLNSAFEKQFAHLMQGELLDIEADIELLKSTLKNGGRKMKTKLIGLGILATVIIAAAAYVFISNSQTVTEINGYVGGEKIACWKTRMVQDILRDRYRLVIDYAKQVPSIWSPTTPRGGDFLFPSNQTALELYKQVHGDPVEKRGSSSIHPIVRVYPQRRGAGLGRQRALLSLQTAYTRWTWKN